MPCSLFCGVYLLFTSTRVIVYTVTITCYRATYNILYTCISLCTFKLLLFTFISLHFIYICFLANVFFHTNPLNSNVLKLLLEIIIFNYFCPKYFFCLLLALIYYFVPLCCGGGGLPLSCTMCLDTAKGCNDRGGSLVGGWGTGMRWVRDTHSKSFSGG